MTWLLSLIPIGGLGLACVFIPGFATRLIEIAGQVVGLIARYPWQAALALALGFAAWCWQGWNGAEAQRDEARATIAKMELASEQARQAQIAANLASEARYRAEAEKTDAEHQKELALARSASDRYARAHGLRAYCAGGSGQTLAPAEDNAPQGGDRPGDLANVVVVQRNDYDLLVDNSLRLKAVHDWGQTLVKEGLAMPEPKFGKTGKNEE